MAIVYSMPSVINSYATSSSERAYETEKPNSGLPTRASSSSGMCTIINFNHCENSSIKVKIEQDINALSHDSCFIPKSEGPIMFILPFYRLH
jgi:hypothetical protein